MNQNDHLSHERISSFIDAELPHDEISTLQQHLDTCHSCALRVVTALQLKAASTRVAKRFTTPPETLARLAAQLRPQTEPPKRVAHFYRFPNWTWAALAASLILIVSLFAWRTQRPNEVSAELLDQHLAVLSSGAVPEVLSTDRHTVKPWFQGKLPFSFNLPEVLPAGAVLKGGDLTYLHGQPAALLLFAVGKHQASVFLTQGSQSSGISMSTVMRSGFTIQHADTKELHITAVSDVNPSDLDHLVDSLVKAQSAP